jgi:hypothetical protein
MSSKDLAIQLADKVVGNVRKAGVREDILETLLQAVENNVREATTEALLVIYGAATVERDKSWVQQLQGEWSPKSGLRTATTPAEVEQEIRNWMAVRIQETRAGAFQAGYEAAFPDAIVQGIKLGWATHEAGKGLEEALKAGKKLKAK